MNFDEQLDPSEFRIAFNDNQKIANRTTESSFVAQARDIVHGVFG